MAKQFVIALALLLSFGLAQAEPAKPKTNQLANHPSPYLALHGSDPVAWQEAGDVNGDGVEDAAATLVVDPGGSGTFTYFALVINDKGAARPLAAVQLGDRIIVRSILVQPGGVMATMLLRRPDEPMTARPRTEITRTFEPQGGRLVEAN